MSGNERVAVALDVGGTSVKAALVDRDGAVVAGPELFPVEAGAEAPVILARFEAILRALWGRAAGRTVIGIGVGMPGPFDYARGVSLMRGLGKYDAIHGIRLGDDWRRRLELSPDFPVRWINDAAAFALGESLFGAGRGFRRMMAVTLGTGCGAAFVVGGRVVAAGEGVPRGGEIYHLPFRGATIDEWLSRRGLLRLWAEMAPGRTGPDVRDLAVAAESGDTQAAILFTRFGELLAEALGPIARAFRPQCLVLGGRIGQSLGLYDRPLRAVLAPIGCCLAGARDPAAALRGAASLIWAE